MTAVQQYLLAVDKDSAEAAAVAQDSATKVETKETKLIDLVQSLGEYLVDDDKTIRARAIAFLSAVLAALSPKTLSRQQLDVIRQFFCDRIEDASGLKEATAGLAALQQMSRFSGDDAVKIATAYFTDAQDLMQHPQGTRFVVYNLFDALLSNQRAKLKEMGDEFLVGFTDLVSGEKDPRNLMIIFSMLKVLIVEWDISNFTNVMFDSVFCYFPITFRPPPDDPYGITAQDLKLRLRECLAASDYFCSLIFPALIDKVDTNSLNVKKDVLQTMAACALAFIPQTLASFYIAIWDAVKFEVLQSQEDEAAAEALEVVSALATGLSKDPVATHATSPLAKFLKAVTSECNEHFLEPQHRQAKPASKLVRAAASASELAFLLVIKDILPPCFTIYQAADTQTKRRALLEILNDILDASSEVYGTYAKPGLTMSQENPLMKFKDSMYDLLSQALMGSPKDQVSIRVTSLQALLRLCKLRNFLGENEIGIIVQHLVEIMLTEVSVELKNSALDALVELSRVKSNLTMNIAFPELLSKLPEAEGAEAKFFKPILETLARLSVEKQISTLVVRRLMSRLDIVLQSSQLATEYLSTILATLLYVISARSDWSAVELEAYYTQVVMPLVNKAIKPLIKSDPVPHLSSTEELELIGRICNTVIRDMSAARQEEIVTATFSLFMTGTASSLVVLDLQSEHFNPFLHASGVQGDTLLIFTYILSAIRRDVALSVEKSAFLAFVVQTCKGCQRPTATQALLRLTAILTNKWFDKANLEYLTGLASGLIEDISADPLGSEFSLNSLKILFWLSKGLALRMDTLSSSLVENLTEFIGLPSPLGPTTARGFSILISGDKLFSKQNHAVIRLLHKQRLFNVVVPLLSSRFQSAPPELKPGYLTALSGILKDVSSDVLVPSLGTLLPLLLQTLDIADVTVREATMDTLATIAAENSGSLETQTSALVSRLLQSAVTSPKNPPRLRQSALRCLRILPGVMRTEILLPVRSKVLNGLIASLGDPKRSVRKEAVDCRAKWFAIDEPDFD